MRSITNYSFVSAHDFSSAGSREFDCLTMSNSYASWKKTPRGSIPTVLWMRKLLASIGENSDGTTGAIRHRFKKKIAKSLVVRVPHGWSVLEQTPMERQFPNRSSLDSIKKIEKENVDSAYVSSFASSEEVAGDFKGESDRQRPEFHDASGNRSRDDDIHADEASSRHNIEASPDQTEIRSITNDSVDSAHDFSFAGSGEFAGDVERDDQTERQSPDFDRTAGNSSGGDNDDEAFRQRQFPNRSSLESTKKIEKENVDSAYVSSFASSEEVAGDFKGESDRQRPEFHDASGNRSRDDDIHADEASSRHNIEASPDQTEIRSITNDSVDSAHDFSFAGSGEFAGDVERDDQTERQSPDFDRTAGNSSGGDNADEAFRQYFEARPKLMRLLLTQYTTKKEWSQLTKAPFFHRERMFQIQ